MSDVGPEGDLGLAHLHELIDPFPGPGQSAQGSDCDDRAGDVATGGATRGDHGTPVYGLGQIRTGSRELAELDLLDALYAGELPVPRPSAARRSGCWGCMLPISGPALAAVPRPGARNCRTPRDGSWRGGARYPRT